MSTALHLCGPEDFASLAALAARHHDEAGLALDDAHRNAALAPLLEGSPLGAAYIAGPKAAPVGYLIVSFGWSVEAGGMDGRIEALWVRPSVRGRGIGTEILSEVAKALSEVGLRLLHASVPMDETGRGVFTRAGFAARDGVTVMTRSGG